MESRSREARNQGRSLSGPGKLRLRLDHDYGSGPIDEDVTDFTDYHGYHFSKATQGASSRLATSPACSSTTPASVTRSGGSSPRSATRRRTRMTFRAPTSPTASRRWGRPPSRLRALATTTSSRGLGRNGSTGRSSVASAPLARRSAPGGRSMLLRVRPFRGVRMDGRLDVTAISTRGEVMSSSTSTGLVRPSVHPRRASFGRHQGGPERRVRRPGHRVTRHGFPGRLRRAQRRAPVGLDLGERQLAVVADARRELLRRGPAAPRSPSRPPSAARRRRESMGLTYLTERRSRNRPATSCSRWARPRAGWQTRRPPPWPGRDGQVSHYRVVIVNRAGRISHHIEGGEWMDVGESLCRAPASPRWPPAASSSSPS